MKKAPLNKKPGAIGIFDSGYGGLTILEEIKNTLPEYDYIYLGDNARSPYGTRSFDVVYKYTLECVTKLFEMGCHLVILACNTASAKALRTIQQIDLPTLDPERRVLGIIRPTVEVLKSISDTKFVGIFATPGTVQSESYPIEAHKICPDIHIIMEACPMWVPLIENNEHLSKGAEYFIKKNIQQLLGKESRIDRVILGCTHYPLIKSVIRKFLPEEIEIISQGKIVAASLKEYLERHPEIDRRCTKNHHIEYYTTESPEKFMSSASIFLQQNIRANHLKL
jgi:glutamate racemase